MSSPKQWVLSTLRRRLGIDIQRYRPQRSLAARRLLIMKNLGVTLVLDVGANVGKYASGLRKAGYGGRIISFEPLTEAFGTLVKLAEGDQNWVCHNFGLGERPAARDIYISANSYSSSFLAMKELHRAAAPGSSYVDHETVLVQRLDDLMDPWIRERCATLLKVDTQGFELEVLRGGPETLQKVAVLEIELSLAPLYEKQPLFREVLDYVGGLGFELVNIHPGFTDQGTGHLLQMDGIFVKRKEAESP